MKLDKELLKKIYLQNYDREKAQFSEHACLSSQAFRFVAEDEDSLRPPFFHDTDRILHSPVYTRYIDKTQVFSHIRNDHITHRVLHVQLVAKIARVIGRALKLNEDLIEAIALGHDLGHVPYGHEGERILDKICREEGLGFFVHNAQSVRAVMELEKGGDGLNLTLQTLDGILCHNGELFSQEYRPRKDKTPQEFLEDYKNCFLIEKYGKKLIPMTMEGCVVRLCDIIAYIGRDVEDAIELKLIGRADLPRQIVEALGDNNSTMVDTLVKDIIHNSYGKDYLQFSDSVFKALKSLREYNYSNIYGHEKNKEDLPKIEEIFRYLYRSLLEDMDDQSSFIYRWAHGKMSSHYEEDTQKGRMVIDYLAGMTDRFFLDLFQERVLPRRKGYKI